MIIHQVVQGSSEWLRLRMGKPTASEFDKILTPTGKPSSQKDGYIDKLSAELMLGQPLDGPSMPWMDRGKELEGEARSFYALVSGNEVEQVGFCTTDDGRIGASPDGLISADGGLELKCPSAPVHAGYLFHEHGIGSAYHIQIQGCLFVCEREWWDSVSYFPGLPQALIRHTRDEECIGKLREQLDVFLEALAKRVEEITKRGWLKAEEPEAKEEGMDWLGITDADIDAILADERAKREKS